MGKKECVVTMEMLFEESVHGPSKTASEVWYGIAFNDSRVIGPMFSLFTKPVQNWVFKHIPVDKTMDAFTDLPFSDQLAFNEEFRVYIIATQYYQQPWLFQDAEGNFVLQHPDHPGLVSRGVGFGFPLRLSAFSDAVWGGLAQRVSSLFAKPALAAKYLRCYTYVE